MGRTLNRLTAVGVKARKRSGYYADGGNLYLRVAPGGTKGWMFRFVISGRTRDMGLGTWPTITLEKAREEAVRCRQLVAAGVDPVETRRQEREAARLAAARAMTFEQCAKTYIAAHEAGWRNAKHRQQWTNTLKAYAYPVIGKVPAASVDTTRVMEILRPLWTSKPETASRVRGRIETILDWAKVAGYRDGENPARWKGHLDHLLPKKGRVRAVKHHAALPYPEVPTFMAALRKQTSVSAYALQFAILTAARSGEVRGCTWDEINLGECVWTISAERMKARREHRVPLSTHAIAILKAMAEIRRGPLVFFGAPDQPLSDMALTMLLRRMGREDITAHGFRSSFRDWVAERTSFPREVAEMALAHAVPNAVEAAYRRGDLFDKRKKLMAAWADYCGRQSAR